MSRSLKKVLQADICAGCGLCESIASSGSVSVELTENGFYRPSGSLSLTPDEEELVGKVCPSMNVSHFDAEQGIDAVWGPVRSVVTGFASDSAVRYKGSSGGVLTALQIHLLKSQRVDAVINVGASIESPLRNQVFLCRNKEDILSHAGSRYAPSAPLRDIHRLIEGIDRLAFVGKPCDVAALKRLAKFDWRLAKKRIYFLSFLCAGVPSQNATESLVRAMGVAPEDVSSFKYRGDGWPGNAKVVARDGRVAEMTYNDSWGKFLNRHLQTRCKVCPDGTGEFADITCGDAWHGDERGFPSFEERDGRSAILVRTECGEELLRSATEAGEVVLDDQEFSLNFLSRMQPYQVNRRQKILARMLSFALLRRCYVRFSLLPALRSAWMSSFAALFREFAGTAKRIIFKSM